MAGLDEDTASMSIEAARNALARAQIDPKRIRAVWVGSESHPYAVKPTSTIVAEALDIVPLTQAADWEFACKAGTEAMQAAIAFVGSGMATYALSIGMDTAQGRPGDALEYTAAAGGAAILVGPAEESLATLRGVGLLRHRHARLLAPRPCPLSQPRPALHRRAGLLPSRHQRRPDHAGGTWPQASRLPLCGVAPAQRQVPAARGQDAGLQARADRDRPACVGRIGNTYAGSSLVGMTAVLDEARPGDRVLVVSFGSGAGSDAFSLEVTERIEAARDRAPQDPRLHRPPRRDRLCDLRAVSREVVDEVGRWQVAEWQVAGVRCRWQVVQVAGQLR